MNRKSIRRSAVGAGLGAAVFGVVSVYRSLMADGALLDYLGPIGMLTVIGGTVGGLVGPLIGEAWSRRRDRRRESDEMAGGRDSGGRQPFWFTLLVGMGVGFGIGTAWERIWLGVALGLVLALLSRRIFA